MMIVEKNGLKFWQDQALSPMAHGFFSRKGGASSAPIASLNCGFGADEPRENVLQNRQKIQSIIGAPQPIQTVYQHHSADVLILDAPQSGEAQKADAIVTSTPNLPIGILTADCGPLLLSAPKEGIIGAAHAGWRGAVGGVVENTIEAMRSLGATDIFAVLGPTISLNNYEVGEEFFEEFITINPQYSEYFSQLDKPHFNLPRFILDRARRAGVECHSLGICTYHEDDLCYSYRRAQHQGQADYGRLMSVIMIP